MKQILFVIAAATGLLLAGCCGKCKAEDRVPGLRTVDQKVDVAKGELERTSSFNQKNEIVGVRVKYLDGRVRNETYTQGMLRMVHETDFKGWSKDIEYDVNGIMVTETVHDKAGRSTVFVNVDSIAGALKDVYLAIGDELHFVSTVQPTAGTRADSFQLKTFNVVAATTKLPSLTPTKATVLAAGNFSATKAGDDEVTVTTTFNQAKLGPAATLHTGKQTGTVKVHVK